MMRLKIIQIALSRVKRRKYDDRICFDADVMRSPSCVCVSVSSSYFLFFTLDFFLEKFSATRWLVESICAQVVCSVCGQSEESPVSSHLE